MEVAFAFLADSALTPPDGKLYVLGGGIGEIGAPAFPAIHSQISLIVRIRIHPSECDIPHELAVELWNPDGKVVGPTLRGQFGTGRNPRRPTAHVFAMVVLNYQRLEFPALGDYEFHILIDGHHKWAESLLLFEISPPSVQEEGNREDQE
jgi:hypothetical protein